jgi:hypothetical protein
MSRKLEVLQIIKDFTADKGLPPTLQQVANEMGITRERVRQLAVKLRADGLLAPGSKSLALPGAVERGDLVKSALDEQTLKFIEQWPHPVPPMKNDLRGEVTAFQDSLSRLLAAGKLHNSQWLVPTTRPEFTEEDYFWSKVDRTTEDDCWLWVGGTNRALGYGVHSRSYFGYKQRFVHQIVYMITNGLDSIKPDHYIFHKCGTKLCCNPKHLVQTDNQEWYAMIAPEDRWVIFKPRLCLDDALDIRARVEAGESVSRVYSDYQEDICYQSTLNIARGKTYTRQHDGTSAKQSSNTDLID